MGPFGEVESFFNLGETHFMLANYTRYQSEFLAPSLLFYPDVDSGKVLICSNLHWLADPEASCASASTP